MNSSPPVRPISRLPDFGSVLRGWAKLFRKRPKLTIVTPVSRPENLPRLKDNLSILKPYFQVCWCCVVDSTKATRQQISVRPNILRDAKSDVPDDGSTQRNVALALIREGWIYFLDDDNMIHPNFPRVASEAISANPGKKCFVFAQGWWDDTQRLNAGPIKRGKVDTGSFLVHRSAIGDAKWSLAPVPASVDFNFISQIWDQKPEQFLFVNEVCTYYNRLRPGEKVI